MAERMASSREMASRWKSIENIPLQVPGVPSSQPAANNASARSSVSSRDSVRIKVKSYLLITQFLSKRAGSDLNADSGPQHAECPWHDPQGSSGSSRPLWRNPCGQLEDNTTIPRYALAAQTSAGSSRGAMRRQWLHEYIGSGVRPWSSCHSRGIATRLYYSIPQQRGSTRYPGQT